MRKKADDRSFNDKMISSTVKPAIYLWLLASGSVVAMGIWKPDVVLENLDGFIALIAIIGGIAGPALNTVLRMWESEQTVEIDMMPADMAHDRSRDAAEHEHRMIVEKHDAGVTPAPEKPLVELTPIVPMGLDLAGDENE
jgi:hypothetical protein